MDENGLSIIAICWAGTWRLQVAGELDIAAAHQVRGAAETLAEYGAVDVHIDLSRVTFTDSAGWLSIEQARALLEASGATCRVEDPSPAVRRIIRLLAGHPAGSANRTAACTRTTGPPRRAGVPGPPAPVAA